MSSHYRNHYARIILILHSTGIRFSLCAKPYRVAKLLFINSVCHYLRYVHGKPTHQISKNCILIQHAPHFNLNNHTPYLELE
jgi:hypothetical protein